ncbi:homoserine dehydrogenase [Apilactobacillus kunkeei]|nr:homoserine dehydrogenase [Apilactobacillus kunkeei]
MIICLLIKNKCLLYTYKKRKDVIGLDIAILGLGTVGGGVKEIIDESPRLKEKLNVAAIWVRKEKVDATQNKTNDYQSILDNDDIKVIVETLGGIHPAYEMIMDAFKAGKNVVTANKAVVAKYMEEFINEAKQNHVSFRFEPSVAGGIPWIQNLKRVLRIDDVQSIGGILNGTSNFIIDAIVNQHVSFKEALKQAQDLGYAEADPTADIDGYDVENKLCISTDLAFNTLIKPGDAIKKVGIRNLLKEDVDFFLGRNMNIKLIGKASLYNQDKLAISIEPTLLPVDNTVANVNGNLNYVQLTGDTIGPLGFLGQGAGRKPTANALLQDVVDIFESNPSYSIDGSQHLVIDNNNFAAEYIIRTEIDLSDLKDVTNLEGKYWTLSNQTIESAHMLYQEILQADNKTIMFRQ